MELSYIAGDNLNKVALSTTRLRKVTSNPAIQAFLSLIIPRMLVPDDDDTGPSDQAAIRRYGCACFRLVVVLSSPRSISLQYFTYRGASIRFADLSSTN